MITFIRKLALSKFGRDALFTSAAGLLARAFGFVVPIIVSFYFGATVQTDCFYLAYAVVLFLTNTLAITLENILVPFIIEKNQNQTVLNEFLTHVFVLVIIIFILMMLLGVVGSEVLLSNLTRLDSTSLELVSILLLEISPMALFVMLNSILVANANAHKLFIAPAWSPIVRNGLVIASLPLFGIQVGIHVLAIASSMGEFLRFLFLYTFLRRQKLIRLNLAIRLNERILPFVTIAGYQAVGLVFSSINPLVDRMMASWTGEASISIIEYAEKIYAIPALFLTGGFLSVLLTRWADVQVDRKRFIEEVKRAIKIIGALATIITICLSVSIDSITYFMYGAGIETQDILSTISNMSAVYVLSIVPYGILQILLRALLSLKGTKSIMILSTVKLVLNIGLNILFIKLIGVEGIALSTMLQTFIIAGLAYFTFKREATKIMALSCVR